MMWLRFGLNQVCVFILFEPINLFWEKEEVILNRKGLGLGDRCVGPKDVFFMPDGFEILITGFFTCFGDIMAPSYHMPVIISSFIQFSGHSQSDLTEIPRFISC